MSGSRDNSIGNLYEKPTIAELHRLEVKFRVGSEYQLIKEIGHGSYGEVCLAIHSLTGREVAIKKIKDIFTFVHDAKRQLREIVLLRILKGHRNVIKLFDILEPEDP